jgi:hypothetical protein
MGTEMDKLREQQKEARKSALVVWLFSLVPYAAVSLGYMTFTDGGRKEFLSAFGVLLVVRLFFSIIEGLGTALMWRLYGKKQTVQKYLAFFRAHKFPMRKDAHEHFWDYLPRIEDNPDVSDAVKSAAREIDMMLRSGGIITSIRMCDAAEEAFELYSPRADAPE